MGGGLVIGPAGEISWPVASQGGQGTRIVPASANTRALYGSGTLWMEGLVAMKGAGSSKLGQSFVSGSGYTDFTTLGGNAVTGGASAATAHYVAPGAFAYIGAASAGLSRAPNSFEANRFFVPPPMPGQTFAAASGIGRIEIPPPRVTALPTTVQGLAIPDGYEVYYVADATKGVIWHLRYNASGGTYKWEHVGGGPLEASITGPGLYASTTWADFTGSMTLPLAGDYWIDLMFYAQSNAAAGVYVRGEMSGKFNGTRDAGYELYIDCYETFGGSAREIRKRRNGTSAAAFSAMYRSATGASVFIGDGFIRATPIRVA